jgi:Flp pilus assembly protein TadB
VQQGENRKQALHAFGSSIRLADLELFRSAFDLVLDHGGKFSPTLERLAKVSKERDVLIGSARVTTSTMRMTANILLCCTPLIVLMVAARTNSFWEVIFENPTANLIASTGLVLIITSYLTLRKMSNFRP